jgi:16S rRNA processing protein RimM
VPIERASAREGFVTVGRVLGARGVRGELRIEPLTDFPERFQRGAQLWIGGARYIVRLSRMHRGALLLQLEGVDTRGEADALRGLLLELPEAAVAELGEGQYYRHHIIGLEVVSTAGEALGRVAEIVETGANDVYAVRNDEGELLLPAIDDVIKQIDLERGRMVVELIPGLERRPLRKGR